MRRHARFVKFVLVDGGLDDEVAFAAVDGRKVEVTLRKSAAPFLAGKHGDAIRGIDRTCREKVKEGGLDALLAAFSDGPITASAL